MANKLKQILLTTAFAATGMFATYHLGKNSKVNEEVKPLEEQLDALRARAVEDLRNQAGVHVYHKKNDAGEFEYFNENTGEQIQLSGEEEHEFMGYLMQESVINEDYRPVTKKAPALN